MSKKKSNKTLMIIAVFIFILGFVIGKEYSKVTLQKSMQASVNVEMTNQEIIDTEKTAQNSSSESKVATWKETCTSVAGMAEQIMISRQKGNPMSGLIDAVDNNAVAESLIMKAYDEPRYNGEEFKIKTIENFKNDAYLDCAKSLK